MTAARESTQSDPLHPSMRGPSGQGCENADVAPTEMSEQMSMPPSRRPAGRPGHSSFSHAIVGATTVGEAIA